MPFFVSLDSTGGNQFNTGPAPPPPPGTPPATRPNPNRRSGGGSSNGEGSHSGGGSKSGIGAGAIAGIVISILVVGAIAAFFIVKRRSRKSSSDIEKFDNQPLAPLAPPEMHGTFQFYLLKNKRIHIFINMQCLMHHLFVLISGIKPVETSLAPSTKAFETPAMINLRPPPVDRHKSFDEDDVTAKPIVVPPKKVFTAPINAKSFSVADLQIATDSFNADNLIGEGSIGRVFRAQLDDGKVSFLSNSAFKHN